jgi:hypothetical protein
LTSVATPGVGAGAVVAAAGKIADNSRESTDANPNSPAPNDRCGVLIPRE